MCSGKMALHIVFPPFLKRNHDCDHWQLVTCLVNPASSAFLPFPRSRRIAPLVFSCLAFFALVACFISFFSEVAFYCLNAIHPVTHAVANTVKRVFLIAVSILVFGHKLTPLGSIGSAVAIGGVLLYSLAKQKFPNKK